MVLIENRPIEESPLVLKDIQEPIPSQTEIRIRVRACGICRTDLHIIEGELPLLHSPLVPGHQVVGVVDLIGPRVSRFKIGDRVGIAWLRNTCGECIYCRDGRENLCEASQFTGYHIDGGFGEYAVVDEEFAYPIPDIFTDVEATPLLCAGIIGYRALKRSGVPKGGRLGIYGFGSSAHIVIQIAISWGCEVYVCSRGREHRELAKEMGARWVGDANDRIPERLDSAIIFAPSGELVPLALSSLKRGGTVALAGIYMSPIPSMDYKEYLFYERNIHSVTSNTREDGRELLMEAARIPIRPKIQTFPLVEANKALKMLKQDRIIGTGVLVIE